VCWQVPWHPCTKEIILLPNSEEVGDSETFPQGEGKKAQITYNEKLAVV